MLASGTRIFDMPAAAERLRSVRQSDRSARACPVDFGARTISTIRTSIKWIAGLGVVAVIALTLLGKKTFHVEAIIPAPPSAVWEVLMDTTRYPEWNPVFVSVSGPYEQGDEILNEVRDPKGEILKMTATVAELVPERKLRQKGGVTGFITFDHQWLLEPVDGGTRVIQHEVDRGLYLWFWDSSWIEPAYGRTNEALKARVMSLGSR